MKIPLPLTLTLFFALFTNASEPGFVRSYQPLGGMANGTIQVEPVICISNQAYNDDDNSLPMRFISMPYMPPSDTGIKDENTNQAKEAGITFEISHKNPEASKIILSVENLLSADESSKKFNNSREAVFTATLECLRLCTPADLKTATVVLATESIDKAWLEAIIINYNKHDKARPFYSAADFK